MEPGQEASILNFGVRDDSFVMPPHGTVLLYILFGYKTIFNWRYEQGSQFFDPDAPEDTNMEKGWSRLYTNGQITEKSWKEQEGT